MPASGTGTDIPLCHLHVAFTHGFALAIARVCSAFAQLQPVLVEPSQIAEHRPTTPSRRVLLIDDPAEDLLAEPAQIRTNIFALIFKGHMLVDSLLEEMWCAADWLPDVPCAKIWRVRHPSWFLDLGAYLPHLCVYQYLDLPHASSEMTDYRLLFYDFMHSNP